MTEPRAQPLDGEPAARVLVAGASGFTGALAAQIVWRHPRLELVAVDLAQRRRHAARPPLPALPGAARADRARPRPHRGGRRGDRRLPARRLGAGRRRAARPRRRSSSTSPPTSACATCPPTSAGTASTARPSCSRAPSTACTELYRERAARGRAGRRPRAATRPRACWRWRRWPSEGLLADVVDRRQAGRLRRRPRRRRRRSTTSRWTRTPSPTRPRATATGPRSSRSWRRSGSAVAGHLRPAPAAARPGRAGQLLRAAPASRSPRRRSQALYRERYAGEPFVRVVDGPPGPARRARHQRVPRLRHGRGARPRARLLGDRQPLEGRLRPGVQNLNLMLGLDETEGLR